MRSSPVSGSQPQPATPASRVAALIKTKLAVVLIFLFYLYMSGMNSGKLLSLGASGTIGDAFTYSKFKSCGYVKKHSHKTQAETTASIAARERLKIAACSWSNVFNGKMIRDAWHKLLEFLNGPQTSYTAYLTQAIKLQKINPTGAFVKSAALISSNVFFSLVDVKAGLSATESGEFEIWVRRKEGSWFLKGTQSLTAGQIQVNVQDDLLYDSCIQIRKDGLCRSGVIKLDKLI